MLQGNNFNRDYIRQRELAEKQNAQQGAMQAGACLAAQIKQSPQSEIAAELDMLHQALSRLSGTVSEMGDRLEPVSLQTNADGCTDGAPQPVMCQTAMSIMSARAVADSITSRLRSQIESLRC